MKIKFLLFFQAFLLFNIANTVFSRTITVKQNGLGNYTKINDAAQVALPGDTILVFNGIYRELVNPAKGGTSETKRITYLAAGNYVYVKGSEIATGWVNQNDGTWKLTLNTTIFNGRNPFALNMKFVSTEDSVSTTVRGKAHSLGEIYVNDQAMCELSTVALVKANANSWTDTNNGTILIANFGSQNPNTELVEINTREQCFSPSAYNLGYITIDGFHFMHAANYVDENFGTAVNPIHGIVSTNTGHHWIIQNCTIEYSNGFGLDYGRSGDATSATYTGGSNIIQNNIIRNTGANGIIGFNISNNTIQGNSVLKAARLRPDIGSLAAIKLIAANNNSKVLNNYVYGLRMGEVLYCDVGWSSSRISGNVLTNPSTNGAGANRIYLEIGSSGQLDNNVFINTNVYQRNTNGMVFTQNLFIGSAFGYVWTNRGVTAPPADATYISSNNHYHSNMFLGGSGLKNVPLLPYPGQNANTSDYNAYFTDAVCKPVVMDANSKVYGTATFDPNDAYITTESSAKLSFNMNAGALAIPAPFWAADSFARFYTSWTLPDIDKDFFGKAISKTAPKVGPFADIAVGANNYTLWPKTTQPVVNSVKVDNANAAISYTGTWTTATDASAFSSSIHQSTVAGSAASFSFTGTGIRFVTRNNTDGGIMQVLIDGVQVKMYDSWMWFKKDKQFVAYANLLLPYGNHTVKIVSTADNNFSSTSNKCVLDYFEYFKNGSLVSATQPFISFSATALTSTTSNTINCNASTGSMPFFVNDLQVTDLKNLNIVATSSNTTLVPVQNIVISSTGSSRTVNITPIAAISGVSTITLTADNGVSSSSITIVLTVASCTSLPVSLTNFYGKNTQLSNQLFWTTTVEINNAYFNIERSLDNNSFTVIGTVKGLGNSNVVNNYTFEDKNAPTGKAYYRLAQVDKDGTTKYSNAIELNNTKAVSIVSFPNPFTQVCTITTNSQTPVSINIIDQYGKLLQQEIVTNQQAITIGANLPKGMYFIKSNIDGICSTQKIIKQ